jgi:hypothetical protein
MLLYQVFKPRGHQRLDIFRGFRGREQKAGAVKIMTDPVPKADRYYAAWYCIFGRAIPANTEVIQNAIRPPKPVPRRDPGATPMNGFNSPYNVSIKYEVPPT